MRCRKNRDVLQISPTQNQEDQMQVTHLRSYLAQVGITMTQFAKQVECSRTYLSKLVAGDAYASPRLARDILAATGGLIKLPTKKESENKLREEQKKKSQDERIKKAAYIASTMMTHYDNFDEHKQD